MVPFDTILQGDALAVLRTLPSDFVQTCVTSPPYWSLRDYGVDGQLGLEATLEEFVERMVAVFAEVRRVLRPDGVLWLNVGDTYHHDSPVRRQSGDRFSRETAPASTRRSCRRQGVLKAKDLVGVPWRLAFALQADGWWLRSDVVWCLSGGTRVYARTQKGEMPTTIKDLVRLKPETVQLWNGEKWTQVLGWSQNPRPAQPIEITLRSGERIGCTPEHQWPTQRGLVRAMDLCLGDVIQTTRLPEPARLKTPTGLDDRDVGWFVGMYLAEGSRSDTTIQIAGHQRETERFARLCRIAEAFHGTCRMHKISEHGATINLYGPVLNGILDAYVAGRVAKDKHLTTHCWERSNAFLADVLEGYLAGDGHYDEANNRWRLGFTRNYALEADLRTLCARLCVPLTLSPSTVHYEGRDVPTFRGEIRFTQSSHWNAKERGEVVAIGHSRARQFWDIGVADEPHTFALASGVLTHNSKTNPMPEAVVDRPTRAHEYVFLLTKRDRYFYDAESVREPLAGTTRPRAGRGSRERVDRDARHVGVPGTKVGERVPGVTPKSAAAGSGIKANASFHAGVNGLVPTRNRRDVWPLSTQPFAGAHFATFPERLVEICVLSGSSPRACERCGSPWRRVVEREPTPPDVKALFEASRARTAGAAGRSDGHTSYKPHYQRRVIGVSWRATCACAGCMGSGASIVLDPFMGSGTTAVVARRHSRRYVGIELNAKYIEMAERRIAAERQPVLWTA